MIQYAKKGFFGFNIIFRLHGSAAFKALTPALLSTGIYFIIYYAGDLDIDDNASWRWFDHPYPLGALMAAFTFLLTFKASFSYNRYWEACTAVHQMHSKWLDVGMEMAAFHLQSSQYDEVKPPSFGKYPEITSVRRDRERVHCPTREDLAEQIGASRSIGTRFRAIRSNALRLTVNPKMIKESDVSSSATPQTSVKKRSRSDQRPTSRMTRLQSCVILDGGMKTERPSLFLQEGSHLLSLLSAVAMSTLRNDVEEAESPLIEFRPGESWPPVDPDDQDAEIRAEYYSSSRTITLVQYLLGFTRSEKNKTLYNAARPFRVLGGVSDAEVALLQAARGPLAKVALVSMWLQEFISREYLAGSTGNVAPPIISRLFQFTSDGMLGYNQARKIAFIPFPFPHAQITTIFIAAVVAFLPILMLSYVNNIVFGSILNCFTVLCFTGLHEVARELENPFLNVPNDIPLNNYQAQFNEALINMYAGYHPDAWWEIPGKVVTPDVVKSKALASSVTEESATGDVYGDEGIETAHQ